MAKLNGQRIGDFIMAPGWTSYEKRHQYQTYDVTDLIEKNNELSVMVGNGWQRGKISQPLENIPGHFAPPSIIGVLTLEYENGNTQYIKTDSEWIYAKGQVVQSDIFDGEIYDATLETIKMGNCLIYESPKDNLIAQEGEIVKEHEVFEPLKIIKTPKGETVIDFGQNLTGYPEVCLSAKKGDKVDLSFAEILDSDGNFYNANYRTAECNYTYICKDGYQTYKPNMTFYGFRYIRINSFPCEVTKENFKAIAVYSDIKQTGFVTTGNEKINKLISNIYWGQKDNFLDIPTDCPQRDERLGWTGDIQVFQKPRATISMLKNSFQSGFQTLLQTNTKTEECPMLSPKQHTEEERVRSGETLQLWCHGMYILHMVIKKFSKNALIQCASGYPL